MHFDGGFILCFSYIASIIFKLQAMHLIMVFSYDGQCMFKLRTKTHNHNFYSLLDIFIQFL